MLRREHTAALSEIVTLMSTHPAALLRRKDLGTLAVGSAADLVIFDPDAEWTFSAEQSLSRSKNTPFAGTAMLGRVHRTVVAGEVIYSAPRFSAV